MTFACDHEWASSDGRRTGALALTKSVTRLRRHQSDADPGRVRARLARIMFGHRSVGRDKNDKQRNYSYVDVLERVADGVHVDIVARAPRERSSGKMSEWERRRRDASSRSTPRAAGSPKPPSSKR